MVVFVRAVVSSYNGERKKKGEESMKNKKKTKGANAMVRRDRGMKTMKRKKKRNTKTRRGLGIVHKGEKRPMMYAQYSFKQCNR